MKLLKFVCTLLLLITTGCAHQDIDQICENSYCTLCTYHQKIGTKCIQYISNDKTLSQRDKNTYIIYYKNMDDFLKTVYVKK